MNGILGKIILISPHGHVILISYRLNFDCIKNMVKYEYLILGLKATILMKVHHIKIFDDSQLVVK